MRSRHIREKDWEYKIREKDWEYKVKLFHYIRAGNGNRRVERKFLRMTSKQVHGAKTEFEFGLARKDDGVSQNDFIGEGVSERTREHDFGFFFTGFEMGIPSLSPSMSSQALISFESSRGSDNLIVALLLSSTPSLIGCGPFST
ncbi:hypothetical protein DVH24_040043 [Malus domestica]|uniref:Uncharacterized protein n=1 Tax=Malus domestica TaxID=3750 RepID=A0A498I774_MALDO|nr:hypothetical protein DVH24_040043 [Malus domestica]